jgi:hypothetical protein
MKKWLVLFTLITNMSLSYAEDYYMSAQLDYLDINVANESFNPQISRLKFGVVASESGLFQGVGLEAVLGQSVKSELNAGLEFDVAEHWGIYTTFSEYGNGTTNFTLYLGYTSTDLYSLSMPQNVTSTETLTDFSYGFTFSDHFTALPALNWVFDCTRFYSDDNLDMDGCGLGVKYDF